MADPMCGKPVGRKPSWMSEAQFEVDHCVCLREPGHEPPCWCEHMAYVAQLEQLKALDERG